MDGGVKGYIVNNQRPADGLVLNQISGNFKSGRLRVYGCPDSKSTTFCYSGYADSPVGDFLGYVGVNNPVLNVYGSYGAILLECDLNSTASAVFSPLTLTWGTPKENTGGDQPQGEILELDNLVIYGGPYNSVNKDAYLSMEFDLIYRGTEAQEVTLRPDVIQGVLHHDFFNQKVQFDGPGTQHVVYKNTQYTTEKPVLGTAATLKIEGNGLSLYEGPVTIANYSPKLSATSTLDGSTTVTTSEMLQVPMTLACTAGPYRGTLRCTIWPDATCASGTSLGYSDILYEIAEGATDQLSFDFPELNLQPETTYYFNFWRTKANGSRVQIGTTTYSFTTAANTPAGDDSEYPVVSHITLDYDAIYSNNWGNTSYPLYLSWLADWTTTQTEPKAFDFIPMFYTTEGEMMAQGVTKTITLNPNVQREIFYGGSNEDVVAGLLVPGPARLAIGVYDGDNFVEYGSCDVTITDGKPAFTVAPSVDGGDTDVDPATLIVDLEITCDRGDGGDYYTGAFWLYIYEDEACASGTSVVKKKLSLNIPQGATKTLSFAMDIPEVKYNHTYYYKYGYVGVDNKIHMFSAKPSFTTKVQSGINDILNDAASSTYYDLQGRRILEPRQGTVVIERRSDGTATRRLVK